MKLRSIFIAIAALAIFAACSNDNDPGQAEGKEAKVSVRFETKGASAATPGSDPYELAGEATIKNLTLLAYKAYDGTLLGMGRITGDDLQQGEFRLLSGKAKIVIVANTPTGAFDEALTYDDFKAALASLGSQSQTNLTMSSMLLEGEILEGEENYIGFSGKTNVGNYNSPIVVTRIAARVEVNSIKTNFVHNEKLIGRQVVIDEIYLSNSKNRSLYFSEKDWGAVEVDGNLTTSVKVQPNRGVTNDFPYTENSFRRYTLENSNSQTPTQVTIKATLKEKDEYPPITKIFRATINANGESKQHNHNFIRRNYIYDLSITFGDNSFDVEDPEDETALDVALQVVPWGTVNQAPSF